MDIKVYLAEQGLTPEEITALVGNEKAAKAMTAALSKFEEGTALATRSAAELETARAEKEEAETFWKEKVQPALSSVDRKVASANSEAARYKTYLQSLKDQGYDVPDELLAAPASPANPNPNPANPDYMTREEFRRAAAGTAPDLVTLISLSNEYQDLYGKPYIEADSDFAEAVKAKKPMRDFVRDKYKFSDKRKERDAAAEQTRIDTLVARKLRWLPSTARIQISLRRWRRETTKCKRSRKRGMTVSSRARAARLQRRTAWRGGKTYQSTEE